MSDPQGGPAPALGEQGTHTEGVLGEPGEIAVQQRQPFTVKRRGVARPQLPDPAGGRVQGPHEHGDLGLARPTRGEVFVQDFVAGLRKYLKPALKRATKRKRRSR